MKKNCWYFLAIFAAFVSMLTLTPHQVTLVQAEEDKMDNTINEEENGFGRSDTFEPGEPTPDDIDEPSVPKDEGGGNSDGDNTDDDNGPPR